LLPDAPSSALPPSPSSCEEIFLYFPGFAALSFLVPFIPDRLFPLFYITPLHFLASAGLNLKPCLLRTARFDPLFVPSPRPASRSAVYRSFFFPSLTGRHRPFHAPSWPFFFSGLETEVVHQFLPPRSTTSSLPVSPHPFPYTPLARRLPGLSSFFSFFVSFLFGRNYSFYSVLLNFFRSHCSLA